MANEIRYKIGVDGARETQQILQGLRRDAAAAGAAATAAQARATAAPTSANNAAAAEARALAQRKAAVASFEQWRRQEEARTSRERDAHLRAGVQAEQQAGQSRMQAIQQFATRAIAVYQTVSQRAQALSGAFGGRSREAMLGENMNLQTSLIRFSRDTGIRRSEAQRSVLSAARASGIDPSLILSGLSAGSDVAGDAGGAALTRHASEIARTAQALGTTPEAIAIPLGQALNRGMGEGSVGRFLNRFAANATASKVAPEEFSGRLGAAIAGMSTLTGAGGEEAVLRTMQLQGVVAGAFSGAGRQAGAKYDQTLGMLNDEGFQRRLQRSVGTTGTVGGRVGGQLADPLTTLQAMARSGSLVTGDQFARLAGSRDAGVTLQTLIQGLRDPNNAAVRDALAANETAGAEYVTGTMNDLQGVAGFGNQAEQMANFVENGQEFATYADSMADGIDTLNSKFPLAVEGLDNFSSGIEKMIGLLGGLSMAQGGAALTGGAGLVGGGGAVAGGGGAISGTLAAVGGGSAAVGGAVAAGVVGGVIQAGMIGDVLRTNYLRDQEFEATGGEAGRAERIQAREIERRNAGRIDPTVLGGMFGARGTGASTLQAQMAPQPAPHAAHAAAPAGPTGTAGGYSLDRALAGGGGRPATVALDRASMDSFATTLATRINAAQGRGESER